MGLESRMATRNRFLERGLRDRRDNVLENKKKRQARFPPSWASRRFLPCSAPTILSCFAMTRLASFTGLLSSRIMSGCSLALKRSFSISLRSYNPQGLAGASLDGICDDACPASVRNRFPSLRAGRGDQSKGIATLRLVYRFPRL